MPRDLLLNAVVAVGVLLPLAATADGSIIALEAYFDGLQEVPPNFSPGTGFAGVKINDVANTLTVTTGTYNDLVGTATFVNLYDGATGTNGAFVFNLTLDTPGATDGTFSGGGALTAAQVADAIADKLYINIGSTLFPGGEIRGQLKAAAVPEPGSLLIWSLLAVAGGAASWRRRRVAR